MRFYTLLTVVYLAALPAARAQEADAYKFAPPPPPALDDYDEIEDDGFESDDTFRPPPPPMPGQVGGGPTPGFAVPPASPPPPPPPTDFSNSGSYISQPGKFRFKIVDGEFWEKGKKRTRGRQMMGRSSQ